MARMAELAAAFKKRLGHELEELEAATTPLCGEISIAGSETGVADLFFDADRPWDDDDSSTI